MKPVNLIPPDARRGDRSRTRTGAVPYVIMAGLGLLLLGVIALAFTSKQVSDKEGEVESLNQELQAKTSEAQGLSSFARFGAMEEMRSGTVASLAESRFDWERVVNELALVIPGDVWLVELTGTVSPAVQIEGGAELQIRDSIGGPALEIVGCAVSQDAVAGFVADLEDIDGVTRVGVASSARPVEETTAAATEAGADDGQGECRTRDFITRFEIVAAFDEVPVPATATAAPGVPDPLAATGSGEVAQAQAQQAANQAEVGQASSEAQAATNLIPGG